jgi:hypothetical protein
MLKYGNLSCPLNVDSGLVHMCTCTVRIVERILQDVFFEDRLCDLVVTVPVYRSRAPGSIPGATTFSEKLWVWNGGLVNTIEELLGGESSGSALEIREYGRRDPSSWLHGTHYPQKLALSSPIRGGRSLSIVRSRTQATEFRFSLVFSVSAKSSGIPVMLVFEIHPLEFDSPIV